MLGLFLLHGTTPFNDLPTMMMPMHGMEFSPLLDIQRSENRMIKYPHSAAEFLFTFTGEAIHRSDLRSDFYNQFFRTHAFGCRLFRRCSPRRKIPQTNESKRREVIVDGRARRQRTSCLEATFEPFAGTRVCHK